MGGAFRGEKEEGGFAGAPVGRAAAGAAAGTGLPANQSAELVSVLVSNAVCFDRNDPRI